MAISLARHRQPLAWRADELGVVAGELQPEGGGLGVDAVAAADARRQLVLQRPPLQRRQHQVDVLEQQVGGARQLHRQRGVEHVGRGHALVQEARLRPHDLRHVGQEGDDVVLHLALDLVDARRVRTGVRPFSQMAAAARLGDHAQLGHGVGGVRLDLEPDAVARLRRPDVGHLGAGVAGDHGAQHRSAKRLRPPLARAASAAYPLARSSS